MEIIVEKNIKFILAFIFKRFLLAHIFSADYAKNLSASDNEESTIDKSETCSVTSSALCSIKSTLRVEFLPAEKS